MAVRDLAELMEQAGFSNDDVLRLVGLAADLAAGVIGPGDLEEGERELAGRAHEVMTRP